MKCDLTSRPWGAAEPEVVVKVAAVELAALEVVGDPVVLADVAVKVVLVDAVALAVPMLRRWWIV